MRGEMGLKMHAFYSSLALYQQSGEGESGTGCQKKDEWMALDGMVRTGRVDGMRMTWE